MPQLPLVGNCDWWRVVRAYHHPPPPTTTCHMVEGCPHLLCHVMWQKTYSKFTQVKFRPAAEDIALGSPSFQNIYESRVNERIVFRTVLWDISLCATVNIFVKSKLAYWAPPTISNQRGSRAQGSIPSFLCQHKHNKLQSIWCELETSSETVFDA